MRAGSAGILVLTVLSLGCSPAPGGGENSLALANDGDRRPSVWRGPVGLQVPDDLEPQLELARIARLERCATWSPPVVRTADERFLDLGNRLPVEIPLLFEQDHFDAASWEESDVDDGANDVGLLWTAPSDGTYVVGLSDSPSAILDIFRFDSRVVEAVGAWGHRLEACEGERFAIVVVGGSTYFPAFPGTLVIDVATEDEQGLCNDRLDNDGDAYGRYRVDCGDPDCADDWNCAGFGCAEADLGFVLPVRSVGSTTRAGNDFGPEGLTVFPETEYLWTAPADGRYRATLNSDVEPSILQVRASCAGEILGTAMRDEFVGRPPRVDFEAVAGQQVVVFVEGAESTREAISENQFELVIDVARAWENGPCDDGLDNDDDGWFDALDLDCPPPT